jgi:hypothetical protein
MLALINEGDPPLLSSELLGLGMTDREADSAQSTRYYDSKTLGKIH